MSSSGSIAPDRRQHRQAGLHVDAHVAAVDRQRERLGGRQSVTEFAVHQQRPHVAESDVLTDQVLDVDTAVAQRAAVFVRLGDLGGECHHALESGDEILRDLVEMTVMARFSHGMGTGCYRSVTRRPE